MADAAAHSATAILAEPIVFLAAAVVAVPLAKRLGLGSVLGYLAAGVAIGPLPSACSAGRSRSWRWRSLGSSCCSSSWGSSSG